MAKTTISTDELILKILETADENGVIRNPFSVPVYGKMLKDRVRYKAEGTDYIVNRIKELKGIDVHIFLKGDHLKYLKHQLQSFGLIQNIDGVDTVDGRAILDGPNKDLYRPLYESILGYSKDHKMPIDDVFTNMGLTYVRKRTNFSKTSKEDLINLIGSYADENGNVDKLRKDRVAAHKMRDWLINQNYITENQDVVAILSDFMIENCPQYFFSTTLVKIEDTIHTYIYKRLLELYPTKVITNLKQDYRDIYYTLTRIKREMPYGSNVSMKEFIETMYPNFTYDSVVEKSQSKLNEREILAELVAVYGLPRLDKKESERPLITDLSKDCKVYSSVYRLACTKMMSVKEYLESLGYRYEDLKQKFDKIKNHLIYMDTDRVYESLNKPIPEGMKRFVEARDRHREVVGPKGM